jgi:hypothetical protein
MSEKHTSWDPFTAFMVGAYVVLLILMLFGYID